MKYDLKDKTIFDFCDNPEILQEITAFDKEEYVAMTIGKKGASPDSVELGKREAAADLLELARMTDNKELEADVNRYYAKQIKAYLDEFNE